MTTRLYASLNDREQLVYNDIHSLAENEFHDSNPYAIAVTLLERRIYTLEQELKLLKEKQ